MKPRLNLCALPHVRLGTPTTHLCAYSGKIVKFAKMMSDRYEVVIYAPESDPVPGATMVNCLSENARIAIFGKDDPNRLPAWPTDAQSRLFNLAAAAKVLENAGDSKDLLLLTGGLTHKPIADLLPEMLCVEPFVGYEGILGGKSNAAYESYFHMSQVAQKQGFNDIRWYDRVIAPFVDPDEFPILNDGKGEYLLFVGRLINRKGPHIAAQIAKATGLPLVVAGAGGHVEGNKLIGQDVTLEDVDYRGPVGIVERAKLMAGARALICPTLYAEPGGNIAIEAQMAGTPVIAPDWGVFSETVRHGGTGFHFRSLQRAVRSVEDVECLNNSAIRDYASTHYGLSAIGDKFDRWFQDLQALWGEGWAAL